MVANANGTVRTGMIKAVGVMLPLRCCGWRDGRNETGGHGSDGLGAGHQGQWLLTARGCSQGTFTNTYRQF